MARRFCIGAFVYFYGHTIASRSRPRMLHYSTEITTGDFVLRDPVTAITNLLMFAAGLIAWRKLALDQINYTPARTWRWFFAGISIAALIGFVVHGLSYYTPPNVHLAIWLTMGLVQSVGVSAAQLATVQEFLPLRQRLLQGFVIGQFVLTTIILISFQSYAVVKYHLAVGLVPIMIWQFILALRGRKSSRWIAGGILVSAVTSVVHGLKLSLSLWFNYNDISHLLIIISIWLIGKGALLINAENSSS